jgi:hypothetical protein
MQREPFQAALVAGEQTSLLLRWEVARETLGLEVVEEKSALEGRRVLGWQMKHG